MFNEFFFDQFSNKCTYDVDLDFSNDDLFDIDFSCTRVKQFSDNVNINKAPNLNGIHGCVLKYCSISLCRPLAMIFRLTYNTQCDHFQQFYNGHNVKVHVPIIRWLHCVTLELYL